MGVGVVPQLGLHPPTPCVLINLPTVISTFKSFKAYAAKVLDLLN